MNMKMLSVFISFIFIFSLVSASYTEDLYKQSIKGVIKEISSDGTYFTINDLKIYITKEFLEESLIEVGDKVIVEVEKNKDTLEAIHLEYALS